MRSAGADPKTQRIRSSGRSPKDAWIPVACKEPRRTSPEPTCDASRKLL